MGRIDQRRSALTDALSLLDLRVPWADDRTQRILSRCVTIEDLRRAAHRQWPRSVRDYAEGGADAEISLRRNLRAFAAHDFLPAVLRDVSKVDVSTELLGERAALPFALAPTGYTRMMHAGGETAAATAAAAAGIPYTISTMSTTSIEEVAEGSAGDLWFQLYIWRDRGMTHELIERARACGYRALMVTVDSAVSGLRVRDRRHGFTIPPVIGPRTAMDMLRYPRWCKGVLTGEPVTFANIDARQLPAGQSLREFVIGQLDPTVTWEDLEAVRRQWSGPLIIKGLTQAADVRQAISLGADAIVLSNHGGRQQDLAAPPIEQLPQIADEVAGRLKIFVDSGIRRGSDLVTALALGADGCLVGRPYLYGLGAGGQAGVAKAIELLSSELVRAMALLGVRSVAELKSQGGELVRRRGSSGVARH